MKKRRNISITTRSFIAMIALSAVFLIVTVLIQTTFFNTFYANIKKKEISTAITTVITGIGEDDATVKQICDETARYYNVCILVTDENMNTVVLSQGAMDCDLSEMQPNTLRVFYENAKQNGGNYSQELIREGRQHPSPDMYQSYGGEHLSDERPADQERKSLLKVSIVSSDSGTVRVIFVNAPITPFRNMTDSLRIQLIVLSAVMLILSLILSFVFSRQLTKPIIEMNDEAEKLASGNFDVHFEKNSGSRELDELGEKLNYAASELSKVDSLRTELIANVSHDLRTPLTLITGYSEMMRDLPGENTPKNLNIIIDESKRLSQIVNDVLDISKYQSGSIKINRQRFNLTEEIESLLERIGAFTSSAGYTFSFEHGEDVFIDADQNAISRVIYNLVSNAINYTDSESKQVQIVQTVADGEVKIDVIDYGKGISQEDLPYVFDRYYRSSDSHVRAVLGSGLGLSIVKSILTAHDAKFGVMSSPGKGSDFWFSLETA